MSYGTNTGERVDNASGQETDETADIHHSALQVQRAGLLQVGEMISTPSLLLEMKYMQMNSKFLIISTNKPTLIKYTNALFTLHLIASVPAFACILIIEYSMNCLYWLVLCRPRRLPVLFITTLHPACLLLSCLFLVHLSVTLLYVLCHAS